MYLHLGLDTMVRTREVVGIFDLDTTTVGRDSREYLARAERQGQVESIGHELPKSFVVTCKNRNQSVYIGPFNTPILKSRLGAGLK